MAGGYGKNYENRNAVKPEIYLVRPDPEELFSRASAYSQIYCRTADIAKTLFSYYLVKVHLNSTKVTENDVVSPVPHVAFPSRGRDAGD